MADAVSPPERVGDGVHHRRTNPLGVKGAGEAGAIGSCPAVMNAIADALWRAYRIRHVDMPATAERVWAAIAEGKRVHTL